MNFFSSMEYALCVGTPKSPPGPAKTGNFVWPKEFRDPVDAALHLSTPRSVSRSDKALPENWGTGFFQEG